MPNKCAFWSDLDDGIWIVVTWPLVGLLSKSEKALVFDDLRLVVEPVVVVAARPCVGDGLPFGSEVNLEQN